jgi:hypothetical protein
MVPTTIVLGVIVLERAHARIASPKEWLIPLWRAG